MRLGYPCINRSIGCTTNSTFRLANYSEENLILKVTNNLKCLYKVLLFNLDHNLLFFRISSDLIPFASHPICTFNWEKHFEKEFLFLGDFIKKHKMRISMHPDQFVLINSPNLEIVQKSISELEYHVAVLNAMKLDNTAKVQIHVGGVYKNKIEAIDRFISNYQNLSTNVKNRLVIENDDRCYSLADCLYISSIIDIPIIFDIFHHHCLNNKETVKDALLQAAKTWKKKDGNLMIDYSSQKKGARKGSHTEHIDIEDFKNFIKEAKGLNFDIMLEIKDKEKSALKAKEVLNEKK